jgi:hypothetical protein
MELITLMGYYSFNELSILLNPNQNMNQAINKRSVLKIGVLWNSSTNLFKLTDQLNFINKLCFVQTLQHSIFSNYYMNSLKARDSSLI